MKSKYKNIVIPYLHFDKKRNSTYYIYNDKEYFKLSDLTKAFIKYELTYHFDANGKTKEVHNLWEVIEQVIKYPKDFHIPRKYYEEYSDDERQYILKLKQSLLKNKLKLLETNKFEDFKWYQKKDKEIYEEIYQKYYNVVIPKKIYIPYYDRKFYIVGGNMYEDIIGALDEIYNNSMYYAYGGSPRVQTNSSFHGHNFNEIFEGVIYNFDKFKIYDYQKECYSKQELYLLELMRKKLKELGYNPVTRDYDNDSYNEYVYLKENHKYLSLLLYNIKESLKERKFKREKLNSHKQKGLK